nr:probable pectin methyltransferase QUA2 [Tanacetum cinerariifolium]
MISQKIFRNSSALGDLSKGIASEAFQCYGHLSMSYFLLYYSSLSTDQEHQECLLVENLAAIQQNTVDGREEHIFDIHKRDDLLSQQDKTVVWKKPSQKNCYASRKHGSGPLICKEGRDVESPYYHPLEACIGGTCSRLWIPIEERATWPSISTLNSKELAVTSCYVDHVQCFSHAGGRLQESGIHPVNHVYYIILSVETCHRLSYFGNTVDYLLTIETLVCFIRSNKHNMLNGARSKPTDKIVVSYGTLSAVPEGIPLSALDQ